MKRKPTSKLHKLKPNLSAVSSRLPGRRKKGLQEATTEAIANLPHITNATVAEHREQVLSSARKYIYPLQHSRDRIVKISTSLFIAAVLVFFAYCGVALYKLHSTSTFIYEVTRVIPFPVAKAGPRFVTYESYLFELRHLMHYYSTLQKEDFATDSGKRHLDQLKKDSMQKVIDDAYVKQLADKNGITVSGTDVNNQIALLKEQNRLGSSDQMLADVLHQYWGWSLDDFRSELRTQLLSQKVASQLDTTTHARASNTLAALQQGKDFAQLAGEVSDDTATKGNGGQFGAPIAKSNRDVPPQIIAELFKLQPGQVSDIINTGYTLEIVKVISVSGDKVTAAHISFNLKGIQDYIKPLETKSPPKKFISV
jgi:parvulin-like peptidyl-prolyl isomerase